MLNGKPYESYSEYFNWKGMRYRCNCVTDKAYPYYGGRGITVSDEWNSSFEAFIKDMGFKPSKNHSLDRIDNDKGYSKENCRWATKTQQVINTRIQKTNKSGIKGVFYRNRDLRWIASIDFKNEKIHLGSYRTLFDAACARKSAIDGHKLIGKKLQHRTRWYTSHDWSDWIDIPTVKEEK
ncbi:MAG: AP2 domain-containing protein [Elusimicrobia bacterium]|nr:AP2 domain-containing protein [Elusimicrobiota bacterium]